MEQAQILTTLKEKLGNTSLSDRTLTDYVNLNLPSEGNEPDDAYFTRHVGVLKSLQGNFSRDVAASVEDFKKNYKPETKQTEHEHKEEHEDKAYKELLDQFQALKDRLDKSDKERTESQIRQSAKAMASSLKIAKKALFDDCFESEKVVENQTSEQFLNAVKSSYEKKLKSYFGDSVEPWSSDTGSHGAQTPDEKWLKEKFKEKIGEED